MPFDEQIDFLGYTVNFELIPGEDFADEVIAEIPGPSAGDILTIDLTSSMQAIINGADNTGWVFVPTGTNGIGIRSSEVSGPVVPELFVSTSAGDFAFHDGLTRIIHTNQRVGIEKGSQV